MESEKNISGISENLAESIAEEKANAKKQIHRGKLHGKRIAISVSESEELEQLGLSDNHIQDVSIEIARYLIVNGATMLYGGDLRAKGFTELFSELSYQYKYLSDKERRFVNYFPFPNSKAVSEDDLANIFKKQVEAKFIDIPKILGVIDTERKYDPFKSLEDRYILSECYADMRAKMANESEARIVVGGKQKNFAGYFPGIVEETFYSMKAGKAVYLLGGFGGATRSIIECVTGGNPSQLTNEFQFDSDFLKEFRNFAADKVTIPLDYDFIVDFFKQHSMESISAQNGLTQEENMVLFQTTNIHELVFLVVKGLQAIK